MCSLLNKKGIKSPDIKIELCTTAYINREPEEKPIHFCFTKGYQKHIVYIGWFLNGKLHPSEWGNEWIMNENIVSIF